MTYLLYKAVLKFISVFLLPNFLFSNGIDLINELFKLERKTNVDFVGKSIHFFGKKPFINKIFTRIADEGLSI